MNNRDKIIEILDTQIKPLDQFLWLKLSEVIQKEDDKTKREEGLVVNKTDLEKDLLQLVLQDELEDDEYLVDRIKKAIEAIDYYFNDSTEENLEEAERSVEEVYPLSNH